MHIITTHYGYLYKDNKKIFGYFYGHLPIGVTIVKEIETLVAEDNYILIQKYTKQKFKAIDLKDGDCEDNYIEMEREDDYNTIN